MKQIKGLSDLLPSRIWWRFIPQKYELAGIFVPRVRGGGPGGQAEGRNSVSGIPASGWRLGGYRHGGYRRCPFRPTEAAGAVGEWALPATAARSDATGAASAVGCGGAWNVFGVEDLRVLAAGSDAWAAHAGPRPTRLGAEGSKWRPSVLTPARPARGALSKSIKHPLEE